MNIKLDKTGGLTEALLVAARARALGLKIMVGSMVATSLAMAPALLLAQDADFVDLDGPLLLARDRVPGSPTTLAWSSRRAGALGLTPRWRYKPSTTLLSLAWTSFATSARPGFFIACMEATGSTAETSTRAVSVLLHDDIAGQHRPDLVLELERAVGELRVARPEDPVGAEILAELRLHRGASRRYR